MFNDGVFAGEALDTHGEGDGYRGWETFRNCGYCNCCGEGCNDGLDGSEACTSTDAITVVRLEEVGAAAILNTDATTYDSIITLEFERSSGGSASSWYVHVNGAQTQDGTFADPDASVQSGSATIALVSGTNAVFVRLCAQDSVGIDSCTDSDVYSIELLEPIPGTPSITTLGGEIAPGDLTVTWKKTEGGNGSSWAMTVNDAEVCTGTLSSSSSLEQSGSCTVVDLVMGDNIAVVNLCNTNASGTASCAASEAVTFVLSSYPPVVTSASSVSVDENVVGAVYTLTASDEDSAPEDLSFFIASGGDGADFTIETSSGVLSFAAPPDFESPTDGNLDNVYQLTLTAEDEIGNQGEVALSVSVEDLNGHR